MSMVTTTAPQAKLMGARAAQKRRKPLFVVKEAHHGGGRVAWRWRAARGIHSAVRQMHRGRPAMPSPGYGAPKAVYGLHPSGLEQVLVYTSSQLTALNPLRQGAILASDLGKKRKLELLRLAVDKKITILNSRDPAKAIESITTGLVNRKKVRQEQLTVKQKKTEEKKKVAPKKKSEPEKKNPGQTGERAGKGEEKVTEVEDQQVQQDKQEQEKEFAEKAIIQKQ